MRVSPWDEPRSWPGRNRSKPITLAPQAASRHADSAPIAPSPTTATSARGSATRWPAAGRRAPDTLAQKPGALAHQVEDVVLDVDLSRARAAQGAEELAIACEYRVRDEGPDLQKTGHAAPRKRFRHVLRVVGSTFDHESADCLRPRQRDSLGDVEDLTLVVGEEDHLLVFLEPRFGEIGRAQARELGEPLEDRPRDGLEVLARGGRLRELADEAAAALASHGIGRGERVAMVFPNGPEAILLFLAASMVGTACPLNAAYKEDEFRFYLADVGARFLLVPPGDGE